MRLSLRGEGWPSREKDELATGETETTTQHEIMPDAVNVAAVKPFSRNIDSIGAVPGEGWFLSSPREDNLRKQLC